MGSFIFTIGQRTTFPGRYIHMRFSVCLLFFLVPIAGWCQSTDKLRRELQLARHDTTRLRLYCQLSEQLFRQEQTDSMYAEVEKAFLLVNSSTPAIYVAQLYHRRGNYYRVKGAFRQSLEALQTAIHFYRRATNNKLLAWALYHLNLIYIDTGNYPQAINQAMTNLTFFEKNHISKQISNTYLILNVIYESLNDKKMEQYYLNKYYQAEKQSDDPESKTIALDKMAFSFEKDGDFKQALPYRFRDVAYARTLETPYFLIDALRALSIDLRQLGRSDQALPYLQEAIRLSKNRNKGQLALCWHELALNQLQQGNKQQALRTAERAVQLVRESKFTNLLLPILETLVILQKALGQYQLALLTKDEIRVRSDSLLNLEKAKAIARIQAQYELDKKENTILLLTKNAQIQRLESTHQRQQLNLAQQRQLLFVVSLAALLVLLSVIGYFFYKARITQRQLVEQKEEILSQALELQAVIQLKNRLFAIIGHDLRSPVASMQARLKLTRQRVASPEDQDLNGLEQEVTGLQHTLDNLLYWSLDQQNGLIVAPRLVDLTELVSSVVKGFTGLIQVKQLIIGFQSASSLTSLPAPLYVEADENLTLIILRNLIHNALKFTPPGGQIQLMCWQGEQTVGYRIVDTGIGMDLSRLNQASSQPDRGTGLGLMLSGELMNRMGGHLYLESQPNKGTTVTLSWPNGSSQQKV